MSRFSSRALGAIRRHVSSFLTDEIEVRRMEWNEQLDEETLISGYGDGEVIYEGPCRVRPTSQQTEVVGESVMMLRNANITLPHSAPAVHRDDVAVVTASQNPDLIGRWFQVTEERISGQEGYKRVSALSIAPSRLWRGGNVDSESS